MKINFFSEDVDFKLESEDNIKSWIETTFNNEGLNFKSLNLIFCSDSFLLDINKTYLQHNFYTDVITFNLSEDSTSGEGEIYISVDTVINNAREFTVSFEQEIYRVIIHGVLHLCGYSDHSDIEKTVMQGKENFYLDRLF
ncbi:MAG TPA: rRNA maturation RNase YbeY [Bacteroidales bacterium]|nr:rRNA maturation RNase YbeY [Bacteroidales bacterium]